MATAPLLWSVASLVCLLGLMGTVHIQAATLAHLSAVPATLLTADSASLQATTSAAQRRRCAGCGVITAMREIGPDAQSNAVSAGVISAKGRELTLRFSDGSERIIADFSPAAWRLGEQVSIIDGMQ